MRQFQISTANNEEAAAAEDTATVPTNHPPFAISSSNNNALENKDFDEKDLLMCKQISEGRNPNDFYHNIWRSKEQIDEIYKNHLQIIIEGDKFEALIESTLQRLRFQQNFTLLRAAYVLQWSPSKITKLFQSYRDNQCKY
jgi:hypothetical protein